MCPFSSLKFIFPAAYRSFRHFFSTFLTPPLQYSLDTVVIYNIQNEQFLRNYHLYITLFENTHALYFYVSKLKNET